MDREFYVIKVWSLPTRLLHWILVCAFAVAFYTTTSELKRDMQVMWLEGHYLTQIPARYSSIIILLTFLGVHDEFSYRNI